MKSRSILTVLMLCTFVMTACGNKEVSSVEELTSNVQQEGVESEVCKSDSVQEVSTEVESIQSAEEETKELNTYYEVVFTGTDQPTIEAIKAIRSVTDYELVEAKTIVDQASAIINLYTSEDEAKNIIETLNAAGLNTELNEVRGSFEIENIYRIDKAFNLSDRGTSVIGTNYRGVMKQNQIVYHVKKNGTAVQTQITFIEEAQNLVEETTPGVKYGIGVPDLEKEDIEPGDILIAIKDDDDNKSE